MGSYAKFLPLLLLLAATRTTAADKAYMMQVTELLGIVEAPLYLRDACLRYAPAIGAAVRGEYAAWRQRHAALLDAIDVKFRKADARARREGSPFSLADLRQAGAQSLDERFRPLAPAEAREVCAGFGEFLREQDATMRSTVPQRLATLRATAN